MLLGYLAYASKEPPMDPSLTVLRLLLPASAVGLVFSGTAGTQEVATVKMEALHTVYDDGRHNAFTDLQRWERGLGSTDLESTR